MQGQTEHQKTQKTLIFEIYEFSNVFNKSS